MSDLAFKLCGEYQNGERFEFPLAEQCVIGKEASAQLVLKGWRIAKQHARIARHAQQYFLEDCGSLAGTYVNGQRVTQYGPLQDGDCVVIGPCQLVVKRVAEDEPELGRLQINNESVEAKQQSASVAAQREQALLLAEHVAALHARLVDALELRRKQYSDMNEAVLRLEAQQCVEALIAKSTDLPPSLCKQQLVQAVLDEALGLGPLEALLRDPGISEIMVNSPSQIFVEMQGQCHESAAVFSSESALVAIMERIVAPLGRRLDDASPMVDARLRDGSRVNAVLPPIALKGPTLTIRKFPAKRLVMDDLLAFGALSPTMAEFLRCCVQARKNVVVAGGTGSGKTTLLNVLTNYIAPQERVVTIEDAAELQLNMANWVSLEARPANVEGEGLVSIRDLVRNALRMRPDRIVVGECRGGEAFDMLAAMNTGHEGSLTTVHANTPREALNRLETLVLLAGMDLPVTVAREHIASSLEVLVLQKRLADGRRIIHSITEVCGLEAGRIQLQELFAAEVSSSGGVVFKGQGLIPQIFSEQMEWLDQRWFSDVA
ncbi:ATPase, T2SS/T4P/T4SS family [Paenalcaligenes sp. Me131]|uniref:ATPase, T2SS/T4P/T4SS family n=1 Tax=Paenalcaligenes sp. Me131 TaxID=3392636 RepID=UPI003D2DADBB